VAVRTNVLEDTSYVRTGAYEAYAVMQKVAENIWHNFITCLMGDRVVLNEEGWKMALNWLLSDFFCVLGYGEFKSLAGILDCSRLHEAIQQDSSGSVFQEVRQKREQLAESIYSTLGKRRLSVLYLLCGYIEEACGTEVKKGRDNGYRAVANLKNIINGSDYTGIRKLVPAYIWIKKGMPLLQRDSIS
jgi:hypothetical protein